MSEILPFPAQDPERARAALWALDPGVDRTAWVRIGCAAKAAGLTLEDFTDWSAGGGNYQGPRDVRSAWTSFQVEKAGGVNAGTLFHLAREAGWQDTGAQLRQDATTGTKRKQADPRKLWEGGQPAPADHPYIKRKGGSPEGLRVVAWPLEGWGPFRGHNLAGWLMVPAWAPNGRLVSIQFIGPSSSKPTQKLNAPGCPMEGAFTVGAVTSGQPVAVVEGIGHAWSVHAVTGAAAMVAFGAGNMERAAVAARQAGGEPVLIPDRGKEDQASAVASRLGCALAPLPADFGGEEGDDVNDLHQARGDAAVQAVMDAAAVPAAEDGPEPLFPLESASIATMLATAPKAREYIIEPLLPRGVTGALVAPGGTGKSFMLMQLAVAVASGSPLLGYAVPEPAGVLMLAAEDDRDEIHRRMTAIVGSFHDREASAEELETLNRLAANLYIQPRVGDENRLTMRGPDGNVILSPLVDRIIATARQIKNLKLIVLDPVSRFRSGDENSSEDATRLVEACERIRKETGATVLLAHHTRKGAAGLQDDIRGASAFVDGLRWAATLHRLNADDAKEFGMDKDEAAKLLRFQLVKANYVAPQEAVYLERGEGGKLIQTEAPTPARESKHQAKAEERYRDVLDRIKGLIRQKSEQGEQLTKNALRNYAGAEGVFGVGDQVLRAIVEKAIVEGEIKTRSIGKRGEALSLW